MRVSSDHLSPTRLKVVNSYYSLNEPAISGAGFYLQPDRAFYEVVEVVSVERLHAGIFTKQHIAFKNLGRLNLCLISIVKCFIYEFFNVIHMVKRGFSFILHTFRRFKSNTGSKIPMLKYIGELFQ